MNEENRDVMPLGSEVGPWQIKDFSVRLRQQITAAARRQGCTVPEWLHRYFQRYGIDGQQFEAVKLATVLPAAGNQDAERLDLLITAACRLGAAKGVARAVRKSAFATLERMLGDVGEAALRERHPLLPG